MEKVSVIISAFNAEAFISKALESLLRQTYSALEVLIADDGSVDNTREIIDDLARRDSRIVVSHNSRNRGVLRTRNRLLRCSAGKFITFLDADDWIDTDKIRSQVDFIELKGVDAVGVNYYRVDREGRVYE